VIASAVFSLAFRPVDEVEEALAGVLAARAATATAGDGEQHRRILAFVLDEVILDLLLHLDRPRLGGAGGQAELDDRRPLVLGRQEAGGQAQEQDRQQRD
jgi:hypothetical protein